MKKILFLLVMCFCMISCGISEGDKVKIRSDCYGCLTIEDAEELVLNLRTNNFERHLEMLPKMVKLYKWKEYTVLEVHGRYLKIDYGTSGIYVYDDFVI